MQVVKKRIKLILSVIGIILLCACKENVPVVVNPRVTQGVTNTVTPSITEKNKISPTKRPTVTVTSIPSPTNTETPMLTQSLAPTLTETPIPTQSLAPTLTETPIPTQPLVPTLTETPIPTQPLVPTSPIRPTKTPTATQEPEIVSPTPIPTISLNIGMDLEQLLAQGRQSLLDISESYYIIFSDCFDGSQVNKEEQTLEILYTSSKEDNIQFQILYSIQQTSDVIVNKIVKQGGVLIKEDTINRRVSYQLESNEMMYQGVIIENEFKKELLGSMFGEQENIIGTMQVVFSYPKEMEKKYETELFKYYVIRVP